MSEIRSTATAAPGRRRLVCLLVLVVLGSAAAWVEPAAASHEDGLAPVRPCGDLLGELSIAGGAVEVTAAHVVPAGAEPEHCAVEGVIEPAVRFMLKLPTTTYRGRYVQHGCGGFCGAVVPPAFANCGPQTGDAAVASTDDGHQAPGLDGSWASDDQAARDDYFFRAPHVVAGASKLLIARYYGEPPRHSYFAGCSNGGREGLLLAQRYPHDFDGIIAGAPTSNLGPLTLYTAWLVRTNSGPHALRPEQLAALHAAVMTECDGLDGLVDGLLEDPRDCTFDPASAGFGPEQTEILRRLYAGPTDAAGRRLYPGGQPFGSELAWNPWLTAAPGFGPTIAELLADNLLRYTMYPMHAPHSSVTEVEFSRAELHRMTGEARKVHAMSLDLREFRMAGGKLILWHGWSDQGIPPESTLDYYARLGDSSDWARLFMVPGIAHCGGGASLTSFDPLEELVSWVEHGTAPEMVVAEGHGPGGEVLRTRPVFAYPMRAKYVGRGSIDDAANFVAVPPPSVPSDRVDWLGEYLYRVPGPVAR